MADVIFPHFKRTSTLDMPVNGQGIFSFNLARATPFLIAVRDKNEYTKSRVWLEVHKDCVKLMLFADDHVTTLKLLQTPGCGLDCSKDKVTYWLSYDRDRMCLKYGKGYHMEQTTVLQHDFLEGVAAEEQGAVRRRYRELFNAEDQKSVELYDHASCPSLLVVAPTALGDVECPVDVFRTPLVVNLPPVVLDSACVSLCALDSNTHMLAGSLPTACKELYENIRKCELDVQNGASDLLLSDAIRHSIMTKGCTLYEKLKEKSSKNSLANDPKTTYLRVTLGNSFGNSPGIPYVLEIWPSGHSSPIHNHGGASAVIKVLHGSIHVGCYNKYVKSLDGTVLHEFDANKGDITWMDRNWYQTHKLHNKTSDYCATIQCYNYAPEDSIHWPYFEYVKGGTYRNQFFPNSDFHYREMRDRVMHEFRDHKLRKKTQPKASSKCPVQCIKGRGVRIQLPGPEPSKNSAPSQSKAHKSSSMAQCAKKLAAPFCRDALCSSETSS